MERIAPTWAAAEWDNVGLLAGGEDWPLRRALLTIDLTPVVLEEAAGARCDAIVAYHPPIFRAVTRMIPSPRTQEGVAAAALANRIAVYSPHTALDAAPGGTNGTLAELCGLIDTAPFEAATPPRREAKLVTFVPPKSLEKVADALFAAGAGRIGDYERCSYRLDGVGTFFGADSTTPVVGRKGRLERVRETRLEVALPVSRIADVAAALKRAHPYEEPAFDIYPLATPPDARSGQGRVGRFAKPTTAAKLAARLRRLLKVRGVAIVGRVSAGVSRGIVCAGAAGSLPFEIADRPCGPGDVVVTGEIRHHDALRYQRIGAAAVALGHWASERPVLAPLASRLRAALPGTSIIISRRDCDPFQ
jgi:dinuclear metal center YbgI/SA1388 family protein